MPQFDTEGAKKAGYSEDEILSHLAKSNKFDIDGARKSGYSNQEIIGHLSAQSKPQSASQPATPQATVAPITDQTRQLMGGMMGGAGATIGSRPETLGSIINQTAEKYFPVFNRADQSIRNFLGGVKPDPVMAGVDKREGIAKTPMAAIGGLADLIPDSKNLPQPSVEPGYEGQESLAASRLIKPFVSAILNTLEGFSTPENAAILVGAGGAGKIPQVGKALAAAIGMGFDAMMASGAIEQAPEVKNRLEAGDIQGAVTSVTELLLAAGMGAHGAKSKANAARNQPKLSARPLESQNARLALEDAVKLSPQELEQRNRELQRQGSQSVADVQQVAHEDKAQDGAYKDANRKQLRSKADELRGEMPRSASMIDELARQKQQPAGKRVEPQPGISGLDNESLLQREADLTSAVTPTPELAAVRQEIADRQAAGQPIQIQPGQKLSRAQRRASVAVPEEGPSIEQQRTEAARESIAERLGLDLQKASPEDLVAVDQLAKEGWTGQQPTDQPQRRDGLAPKSSISRPLTDRAGYTAGEIEGGTPERPAPLSQGQSPEASVFGPQDSFPMNPDRIPAGTSRQELDPSPKVTPAADQPQGARKPQSVQDLARDLGLDPEKLKHKDLSVLSQLSAESVARYLGVDMETATRAEKAAVKQLSKEVQPANDALPPRATPMEGGGSEVLPLPKDLGGSIPEQPVKHTVSGVPQTDGNPPGAPQVDARIPFRAGRMEEQTFLEMRRRGYSAKEITLAQEFIKGNTDLKPTQDRAAVERAVREISAIEKIPTPAPVEQPSLYPKNNEESMKRFDELKLERQKLGLGDNPISGKAYGRKVALIDRYAEQRGAGRTADQLKADIKGQLGNERGSVSGKRTKGPSLSENLVELAGVYLREGVQKFSEFIVKVREVFGKVPSGAARAWNAAKKLNQDLGRGNPERGSIKVGGKPEDEAKARTTASGSGGRGGRTTETKAAAGAEADPRGTGGEPVRTPDKLGGERKPTVSPSYDITKSNILKHVAPEVREAMAERLKEFEARTTERKVIGFKEISEESRSLGVQVADLDIKKMKAGETLDPAVRFAAEETVNGLNQELNTRRQEMVKNAGTWDEAKRIDEMRKVEAMEEDVKRLVDVLIPTRSQDGRNLAYHAMMSKASFDVTYWLSRARRAQALPEGVELPSDVEKGIREITGKGAAAEAEAVKRIQGDPVKEEAKVRRKAEQEAKAELGPEPVAAQPTKTRVKLSEQRAPQAKPDPTLAEKQARYRKKLLAKIDEKMKGIEKKPKAKSKWELTPAERAEIDNDPAVKQSRVELARKMMRLDRSSFLETVTTLRRAGLLTSVRTHIRNAGGNTAFQAMEETSRLPALAVDAALSVFTGNRSVQGPSATSMFRASRAAATRGVKEAAEIMRKGATDDQLAQMDMVKELNSGNRYLDAYANTIFRSMSAADRIFKTFAYERSMQEQLKLSGKSEPTEGMRLKAWEDANFATFNNDNMASDLLKRGKSALAKYGEAGQLAKFAIDLAVPFARTPANIVARVIDYTPVGSAARVTMAVRKAMKGGEGLTPEFQQQISMAIGRGAVGSALLTLGWNLSQAGLMTGIAPESRGERDVDEAAGRMYGSFLIGGKWHKVDAFSPLGNMLTLGATLHREQEKGAASILFAGAKTVMEQPMLSGASQVVDAIKDPSRSANRFAGSVAGSFVPSAVADVASAFDNKRRDTKGENLGSSVAGAVSNRVPGLRNTLPERKDVLGREQRQEWLSIVDPTIGSEAKELSNPVLKEMVENRVVMQKPNRPKEMSVEAYHDRQKLIGDVVETRLGTLITSSIYTGDDSSARRKLEKRGKVKTDDGVKAVRREMIEAEIANIRTTFTRAAKSPSWDALSDEDKKGRVLRRLKLAR